MCVPGPGRYLVTGPRSWPGRAMEGSVVVIVRVCEIVEVDGL
jgi:hypothetical protein